MSYGDTPAATDIVRRRFPRAVDSFGGGCRRHSKGRRSTGTGMGSPYSVLIRGVGHPTVKAEFALRCRQTVWGDSYRLTNRSPWSGSCRRGRGVPVGERAALSAVVYGH
ncbi:hypothetical protein FAGKG844_20308 [Frankia sp. AgKG'84/4]